MIRNRAQSGIIGIAELRTGRTTEVATSLGPIGLTAAEHALLARLLLDTASAGEGQAFYAGLTARGSPFPMEWELHILRATIAALPDRLDLIARLAEVEETVSPGQGHDSTSRLAFEKAWVRFARADLAADKSSIDRVLDDVSLLLSSPVFDALPVGRRVEIVVALHGTLMSVPSRHLPVIAELGLRRLETMLGDPALTEPEACAVYDALHSLYFAGVSDVRELRRFDRIVAPFEAWLEARHGRHEPPTTADSEGPLTIGYIFHTAHFDRGNAVTRLMLSLAEMHTKRPGRHIIVYAAQYVADDFPLEMERRGITVRTIAQDMRYDRIDDISAAIRADNLDILLTEQNRAIAAALFVRRVAPRQIWIDTGFPFWSLRALDWTISPSARTENPPPRTTPLVWRQAAETLAGTVNEAAVAALRATFPAGAFVLGIFARLIKADRDYLAVIARLLAADPRFHLVIAGPGDPREVEAFARRPGLEGRVTFVPGSVDLNLYGPAIDLMLDTFPFIGGNACREVSVHGAPVLSKLGTPWDPLLRADRNPELLAASEDAYIALALRMLNDSEFRNRQRKVALEMAAEYTDPTRMLDDVEAAIAASMKAGPQ